VIGAVLEDEAGARRFDAGRIVPEGREESFAAGAIPRGPAALALRTDGGGPLALEVAVERGGRDGERHEVEAPARGPARWSEIRVVLDDVAAGDRIRIRAARGTLRSFHTWLLRP
jgi:hypothetical protein